MSVIPKLLRKIAGAGMASYRWHARADRPEPEQLSRARIALLKLDGIGDFILATTSLRLIEKYLPNACVTLFCRQPVGEIAREQFPAWQVIELPKKQRPLKAIYAESGVRRMLRSQPAFDCLVDLRTYRDMSDSAVASWIPARVKVAMANAYPQTHSWVRMPFEPRIYDIIIPLPDYAAEPDVACDIQNHRAFARYLLPGCGEASSALPRMHAGAVAREETARLLETRFGLEPTKPFLLVCPGTSSPIKEYGIPALAEAIRQVVAVHPMPVVIAGSPSDERTTKPLHALLKGDCNAVDVSGLFSLPQHTALIEMASALLTMDSCHAHIAGAVDTPAVTLLGGGHYRYFAPWGASLRFRWLTNRLPCFGCEWQCTQSGPLCITGISSAEIARNLVETLDAPSSAPAAPTGIKY